MIKYIGKRILFSLVSLLALITVTFFLTRMMPGNPFQLENINPSVQEQILKQYGLDRPVGEQFLLYLKNLSHGDLGMSYKKTGISVNSLIAADAPYTIRLGLIAYGDEGDEVFIGRDLAHTRSYSEEVAKEIDQEIHDIIDGCHQRAKEIILQHQDVLHKCAALLLEKEKVQRDEFEALFTE